MTLRPTHDSADDTGADLTLAALAGFARGMGDFWPLSLPSGALSAGGLDRAERCVRGSAVVAGSAGALRSIFDGLSLLKPGPAPAAARRFAPLRPLAATRAALFAQPAITGDLAALKDGFRAALGLADADSPSGLLARALDAAQRFAWCAPVAGYGPDCDVSLYDHARCVAAVATCIAAAGGRPQPPFALIGGDLSGIQTFIYTLASDGAARSLRARSFYVQLLTEAMARFVLGELGLPPTSVLYVGGGGFQLLAPAAASAQLEQLESDLQRRLLITHRAALNISLRAHVFGAAGFDGFGAVRDALGRALNRAKRRPFGAVEAGLLAEYIGRPIGSGGELDFCRVTGEELLTAATVGANDDAKSEFVQSLEALGRDLRRATHLTLKSVAPEAPRAVTDWPAALRQFGLSVRLQQAEAAEWRDPNVVVARFDPEPRDPAERSIYYPLAKLAPVNKDGEIKLFDELAAAGSGLKRWAVLRLDVDNLGRLFREGFGQRASLARTAGLSFALRLFFEAWLPELAREHKLQDRLYIQYAGGDDVFLVGAWDAVAEFALRIRQSFREYVGGNPSLTLSGGIALADAHFPLYQAARLAGDAEDAAKRHNNEQKDAITFLDQTLTWDEFERAHDRVMKLRDWCKRGLISRAFLQTLQQLDAQAEGERAARRKNEPPKRKFTRATWLAAYQLTRVAEDVRKSKAGDGATVAAEIEAMQVELMRPDANARALALAARWAQFLLRGRDGGAAEADNAADGARA